MINKLLNRVETKAVQTQKDPRSQLGTLAGQVGLGTNLLLFISKFLIGLFSGSLSIMADAMNNLSDTFSSLLTLVGFHIAGKPADEEHPYGHQRFEYISGLIISFLIIFVGLQFFISSLGRIRNPESMLLTPLVFIILILSVAIKLWQGFFYQLVAKKIDSTTLIATAKDSFNDVYTTLIVLLSATIEGLTGWRVDGYMGLLIACYIIYGGIQLIREFVDELLGQRPQQSEIDQMTEFLAQTPDIIGYHDLLIHQYGPNKTFASVHIEIDDRMSLTSAHEKIDDIEYLFRKQLGVELVCHIDPISLNDKEQLLIQQTIKEILTQIDPNLRAHDIRTLAHEHALILFDLVLPTKFQLSEKELTTAIQAKVTAQLGAYRVKITFDHSYLL